MLTVILTGGKSKRMGRDKALLEIDGILLPHYLAQRYEKSLGPVAFSVDKKGRFPSGGYLEFEDEYPGRGPLNGLYSAFSKTQEDVVFLTATDMPNGDPKLIMQMHTLMGARDICIIRRKNGWLEPLFALYRKTCLSSVKTCLENGKLSLLDMYREASICEVNEEALYGWDLNKILYNINTPKDLIEYQSGRRNLDENKNRSR